jgi:hypothetical protein
MKVAQSEALMEQMGQMYKDKIALLEEGRESQKRKIEKLEKSLTDATFEVCILVETSRRFP